MPDVFRVAGLILLATQLTLPATAAPAAATTDPPGVAKKRRTTQPASEPSRAPPKKAKAEKPGPESNLDLTKIPLLVTYDPEFIGIGGPCPGDNELSRGECHLAKKELNVARANFLDAWNIQRSPFASMRLGDISLLFGDAKGALQWYELISGSIMMQRMANLRRCELEIGCGVTGKNLTRADSFTGPFGDEALLRTARIYARSGFPELAATILIDGDGRGCDIAPSTCEQIAKLALRKAPTAFALALSLTTRRPGDGDDELRIAALRDLGLEILASDLALVSKGASPPHRVTQSELAATEARLARLARQAARRAEAEARRAADTAALGTQGGGAAQPGIGPQIVDISPAAPPIAEQKEVTPATATPPAQEEPPKTSAQERVADRTKRAAIDAGLKDADEAIQKARRLLELAGGALPLGGPE